MDHASFRCGLLAASCTVLGCVGDPQEVVENEGMAELEPLAGDPAVGPPVFEVTVEAVIDPPYDEQVEGELLGDPIGLFPCGAVVFVTEDEVQFPEGTVAPADVGAVILADYQSFADQGLPPRSYDLANLSVVLDTEGSPVFSESNMWERFSLDLGVFPRALDTSVAVFEITPGDPHMLTLLDPSTTYDEATQTLTTAYEFQTESGQQHSITETYRFSGRHLAATQSDPVGCD